MAASLYPLPGPSRWLCPPPCPSQRCHECYDGRKVAMKLCVGGCLLCVRIPLSCRAHHSYCCGCAASCSGHKPLCVSAPNPPRFAYGIREPALPLHPASPLRPTRGSCSTQCLRMGEILLLYAHCGSLTPCVLHRTRKPRTHANPSLLCTPTRISPSCQSRQNSRAVSNPLSSVSALYIHTAAPFCASRTRGRAIDCSALRSGDPSPLGTWWVVSDLTKVLTPAPLVGCRRRMRPSKRDIT